MKLEGEPQAFGDISDTGAGYYLEPPILEETESIIKLNSTEMSPTYSYEYNRIRYFNQVTGLFLQLSL